VAKNLTPPSGPVFQPLGSFVPREVLVSWLPPVPAPIVGPKFTTGLASANPPFVGGARVPLEVQIGWIPPPPMPILARNLILVGGAINCVPPQGNQALSPTAPSVAATANIAIVPIQGNVALSPTPPIYVVDFRITPVQGNVVLSGTPPQTTPGLHPVSGNLGLSSVAPVVVQNRLHHWRQTTSLRGTVDAKAGLKGSVDVKPGLKGD